MSNTTNWVLSATFVLLFVCSQGCQSADSPADSGPDAPGAETDIDAEVGENDVDNAEVDALVEVDALMDTEDAPGEESDTTTEALDLSDEGRPDATLDAASDVDVDAAPSTWRSVLYPVDWTPETTDPAGKFLHDFSYAGYRLGEAPWPDLGSLRSVSIEAFGAAPDGSTDTAPALRAAVAAAGASASEPVVIRLPAGLYRFDQRVVIDTPGIILMGDGAETTRLHFTSAASSPFTASLSFSGKPAFGAHVALATDGATRSNTVLVADASSLDVGDEVAIGWTITADFVADHQMTAFWTAFNETWQPFFRRRVVARDMTSSPHRLTFDVPLRYPALVRDGASVRRLSGLLSECGLVGVGLANAVGWEEAWSRDQVHVLAFDGVVDCFASDLASFPSPSAPTSGRGVGAHLQSSGLLVRGSHRVTIASSELGPTQNRGGGGNGYLFEVRQSNEVLFRDLTARAGRHNFIQNWGFGVSGVVWLRTRSSEGRAQPSADSSLATVGLSEFHHSLATANLIDTPFAEDGWSAANRRSESTGAGHTATQNVFWNFSGPGILRSYQHGMGYIIGTAPESVVQSTLPDFAPEILDALYPLSWWYLTEPWDWVEGEARGGTLEPQSLYEDQLRRRLERTPRPAGR